MSTRPAAVMDVAGKGEIAVGGWADFAVVAPDQAYVVEAAALEHRHPISPYQGCRLTGVVRTTYLRGTPITRSDQPRGTLLSRTA
jgi:allantoinase